MTSICDYQTGSSAHLKDWIHYRFNDVVPEVLDQVIAALGGHGALCWLEHHVPGPLAELTDALRAELEADAKLSFRAFGAKYTRTVKFKELK